MSSNELYFTVLGSSGAGKTTLLACMNKYFKEMFAGVYHAGDSGSLDFLADSYKHLEDKANDSSHLDFGIAVTNTENFREYSFTFKSRGGKIPVRFSDFPGGWLNSPETDEDRKNSAKLAETVGRSDVIFVAVSAPYLMEYDGKYSGSAKIDEIQNLLRKTIYDSENDRLILIVPMKCEKYMKDSGKIYDRIKAAFRSTTELAGGKRNVALAVVPVSTIGNAKFSRFDFDGGKIVREFFTKQANSKFDPKNTDQPLRFAMSFFLNHYSLPDDLKKIADDIQKGIKWECAEILSGEGLITGEAVKQLRSLNGSDINPDDILIKQDEPKEKPKKKTNKYKIAVMGASGVGKTVFLGSYFKRVYDDGKGCYTIDIHSQEAADRVHSLIHILFDEKRIVAGTSQRTDFSFSVNDKKPKMDIELFDVEGELQRI